MSETLSFEGADATWDEDGANLPGLALKILWSVGTLLALLLVGPWPIGVKFCLAVAAAVVFLVASGDLGWKQHQRNQLRAVASRIAVASGAKWDELELQEALKVAARFSRARLSGGHEMLFTKHRMRFEVTLRPHSSLEAGRRQD